MENEGMEKLTHTEKHESPKFRLMITRHAERLPTGELSEEGRRFAREKGAQMKEAEVFKGYASDHPSKRAYDTAELMKEEAQILSPSTEGAYETRARKGIQYAVLGQEFKPLLTKAKDVIDEGALKEAGYPTERDENGKLKIDIDKLPLPEQMKIAPIRAEKQRLGLNLLLENKKAVHKMAMGIAHQLVKQLHIAGGYKEMRDKKKPLEKDVILNTVTHGAFMESLLKEAGVFIGEDGSKKEGFEVEGEFGGYIKPGESIYLDIENPADLEERIPLVFEGGNRLPNGRAFIDVNKMKELSSEYKRNEKEQKQE